MGAAAVDEGVCGGEREEREEREREREEEEEEEEMGHRFSRLRTWMEAPYLCHL